MSELMYLGVAVAASIIGSLTLWFCRGRQRPLDDGVHEFSRGLAALQDQSRKVGSRPPA